MRAFVHYLPQAYREDLRVSHIYYTMRMKPRERSSARV